jgi:hypothetical protein
MAENIKRKDLLPQLNSQIIFFTRSPPPPTQVFFCVVVGAGFCVQVPQEIISTRQSSLLIILHLIQENKCYFNRAAPPRAEFGAR